MAYTSCFEFNCIGEYKEIILSGMNAKDAGPNKHAKSKQSSSNRKSGKPKTNGKKKKTKKATQPTKCSSEEETTDMSRQLHSQTLSPVLDELRPRLRIIRNRLNDLTLQKSAPKQKGCNAEQRRSPTNTPASTLQPETRGGKAGKVFYPILVGEPNNLYKPFKCLDKRAKIIDLHGCTKCEALEKLETNLPVWVESAMTGEFPFLVPVDIICGGGNQVLSDAVAHWIRSNRHVANRPKAR